MVWLRTLTLTLLAAIACQQAAGETVLLAFTTRNCGPCNLMRPVVRQLATEGYAVREVDASSQPQSADQYRVTGFPTFIVLVDRREYARLEGSTDHRTLVEMIHRATAIAAQQPQSEVAESAVAFVAAGTGYGQSVRRSSTTAARSRHSAWRSTAGARGRLGRRASPFAPIPTSSLGSPPVQHVAARERARLPPWSQADPGGWSTRR